MRIAMLFVCAALLCGKPADPHEGISRARKLYIAGEIRQAEQELQAVVAGAGPDASGKLVAATAWQSLGILYQDTGKVSAAEAAYEKAIALSDRTISEGEALRLRALNSLASLYLETERIGEAERTIRLAVAVEPKEPSDAAQLEGMLASLDMVRGRNRDAEQRFLRILGFWEHSGNVREQAVVLNNLGVLALKRNDAVTAASRLGRSVELWQRAAGEDHPISLTARSNHGYALLKSGQSRKAVELLEASLPVARKWYGDDAAVTANLATVLAEALAASGRKYEARRMKAEAERMSSGWAARDPARHTVDIRDLPRGR
jgi:tetratricopeptide (TPR) repeat protein